MKSVDDEVFAGTLNGSGALRATVTRDPSQTVVARIVAMVADASATKAKTQLFIEKVEQRYSVVVVVATLALFAVPMMLGADLQSTLLRAMTFMIVASPCAMVLATMPPLLSAIANASRHGVLVKSAVAMERMARYHGRRCGQDGHVDVRHAAAVDHRIAATDASAVRKYSKWLPRQNNSVSTPLGARLLPPPANAASPSSTPMSFGRYLAVG